MLFGELFYAIVAAGTLLQFKTEIKMTGQKTTWNYILLL